jgi:hypothetical protein
VRNTGDIFDPAVPAGIKNFPDFMDQLESKSGKTKIAGYKHPGSEIIARTLLTQTALRRY